MKFEILQEQLVKSLGIVAKGVATRPQLPVLSNILVEAREEGLVLSATDLEMGISTRVAAKVLEKGTISVPARMFLDFVSNLPAGKIECKLEKETLAISSAGFRGKVQTIAAEEFPKLPEPSKEIAARIGMERFKNGVEAVVFAAAKDVLRPVLTGVLMVMGKNKLKLVATDGFRLSLVEVGAMGDPWGEGILVPSRAISEAAKLFSGEGEVEIHLYPKTSQVMFVSGDTTLVSQQLSGNYPEYGKIIPKEFSGGVEMGKEELLAALRAVFIFARDNSNVVKWEIDENGLKLSGETPEKGEAGAEVEGEVEGEKTEIVFNAKFVLDYLQSEKAERVKLSVNGALSPGVLAPVKNKDDVERLYVVMPINA